MMRWMSQTGPPSAWTIRSERLADHQAVRRLNLLAFGQPAEAELVDALRANGAAALSLVAAAGERVLGHILFSPVRVDGDGRPWSALGLAPMAVQPEDQRRGVGSALVRAGLEQAPALGHVVVFVLGHPAYDPRFGFRPAHPLGLFDEYGAPDDAFLVAELVPGALGGRRGTVRYRPEFAAL